MWWIFPGLCEHIVAAAIPPTASFSKTSPQPNSLAAPVQKMLRHFACQFGALRSRILQIWEKCQNLEIIRNLTLFQIYNIPRLSAPKWLSKCLMTWFVQVLTHWSSHCPARKCQNSLYADSDHLKVEYCKSEKSYRILRSTGIWHFFQICNITLLSSPNWLAKWVDMLHPGLTHRSSQRSAGKCWDTLHAILEHLETEYCRSEKSARILRSSGIWNIFQICNIPLLSAPNWHAKWLDSTCFIQAFTHSFSQRLAGKCQDTLHADSENLEVEYCKYKISARILRYSGIWISFHICNIPLLSAPNLLAKWINMLCPGTHTQILTVPWLNRSPPPPLPSTTWVRHTGYHHARGD